MRSSNFDNSLFEIEHDHVLEVYQRGTTYLNSTPKNASVKLLKFILDESKTRVDVYILRGFDKFFIKTFLINDQFKSLSEKNFLGIKIKFHINMRGMMIVSFDSPSTVSLKRIREMKFA